MAMKELRDKFGDPDFGLDGIWSDQTRQLISEFGNCEIELNKFWALTPQNWNCPSCRRSKREVARLSNDGILLAKLVSHHDHAEGVAKLFFAEKYRHGDLGDGSIVRRDYLKKFAVSFLVRFAPVIICEECNVSEVGLKKRYSLPSYVTLKPEELARFSSKEEGFDRSDIADLAEQLKKWGEDARRHLQLADETFNPRLHSVSGSSPTESHVMASAQSLLLRKSGVAEVARIDSLLEMFLESSISKPQTAFAKDVLLPQPTVSAFETYSHPHKMRNEAWLAVPGGWKCPICTRTKFECFRSSPKKPKCFHGNVFLRPVSQVFPEAETTDIYICGDCNDFPSRFREYLSYTKNEYLFEWSNCELLDAELIKACLRTAPHQRHSFDFDRAVNYLLEREAYESGPCEF